ncbi:hypothetical protein [Chitinophaga sp. OAE865]|uniref:hypothetical protein n=1 Tax=Chitinophaga sp. OAE865 TaxID=2817898 RepID=UPI001AEB8853
MKIFLLPAIALLLLPACHRPEKPVKERPVQIDTMQLIAAPAPTVKVASNEVYIASRDSTTYIHFGDCYFSLDWVIPDTQLNDFELRPDTLYFRLAHPHTIEGQMLAFTTGEINKLKISQCYETSAVVEHEALANWKHYRSPWEMIPPKPATSLSAKDILPPKGAGSPPPPYRHYNNM